MNTGETETTFREGDIVRLEGCYGEFKILYVFSEGEYLVFRSDDSNFFRWYDQNDTYLVRRKSNISEEPNIELVEVKDIHGIQGDIGKGSSLISNNPVPYNVKEINGGVFGNGIDKFNSRIRNGS